MDENTLKRLQDLAEHARDVLEKIQQPPQSNAMLYQMPKGFDKELREIEIKLLGVVADIDKLSEQRP